MKKVLVTGAHGFIGHYVVEELVNRGYDVLAFDHHQNQSLENDYPPGVEIFLGDVRDEISVTEAMAHADGWIHLAAVLGTQETVKNPRPAALSNVLGGLNILEAAAQYDLPGVYICVGNHWMNNTYSITKTTVERFCQMFNKDRGTRINMVRAVNAYGPRQLAATPFAEGKVRKIIPSFVCRALSGIPVEVYGDGNQVSDMVWVGDLAYTLVTALEAANEGIVCEKVIECGPQTNNTVNEVASKVIEIAESLGYPKNDIVHLPMRPGEIEGARVTADTTTLAQIYVDPDTFTDLDAGLLQTVTWFRDNKGKTWDAA